MEGIFFLLIGAVIFSQSWHVLGLYSEGRTMGVFATGLGLLSLGTVMFGTTITPTLISGEGSTELFTALTAFVVLWAIYSLGVGVQAIWETDPRALGFYSLFLSVASLVVFLIFALAMAENGTFEHSLGIWLAMSTVPFVLTIVSAIAFFYYSFELPTLRLVTGWFMLFGGGVTGLVGLWALTSVIS